MTSPWKLQTCRRPWAVLAMVFSDDLRRQRGRLNLVDSAEARAYIVVFFHFFCDAFVANRLPVLQVSERMSKRGFLSMPRLG